MIFSKRIRRGKLLDFFAAQPNCTVALEACGGAHHWARQLTQLGADLDKEIARRASNMIAFIRRHVYTYFAIIAPKPRLYVRLGGSRSRRRRR